MRTLDKRTMKLRASWYPGWERHFWWRCDSNDRISLWKRSKILWRWSLIHSDMLVTVDWRRLLVERRWVKMPRALVIISLLWMGKICTLIVSIWIQVAGTNDARRKTGVRKLLIAGSVGLGWLILTINKAHVILRTVSGDEVAAFLLGFSSQSLLIALCALEASLKDIAITVQESFFFLIFLVDF